MGLLHKDWDMPLNMYCGNNIVADRQTGESVSYPMIDSRKHYSMC